MQVQFTDVTSAIGFIHDGRLRALAVTAATASPVLPGIPPLASLVPGYEVSAWFALSAPKATPVATIATLNKAVNATLAESKQNGGLRFANPSYGYAPTIH